MRLLWSWLCEMVDIPETPEAFGERLTRAGLEVESIESYRRLPPQLKDILIGKVIDITAHPAADRLLLTKVQVHSDKTLTIVTGARNLQVGDMVPVAMPGSYVRFEGKWAQLEPRTFRGVLSEGMLCSEVELGIGNDTEGILRLSPEAPMGESVVKVLEDYTDIIFTISATPNRGDALSHLGVAREYAALTKKSLRLPDWKVVGERVPFPLDIEVLDPDSCPRYGGVYVEGIQPGVVSPSWLRLRLEALGMRSIHPVVDITNYILLGYGQPLHAFDIDQMCGTKLRVAPLTEAQGFIGLGRQSLDLSSGDVVISDAEGPACLAGLLGGERTSISTHTQRAFIESAYFSPQAIRRTGRRLGITTESGYRFMRGTDPHRVPWAAEAAGALIQQVYPEAIVSKYTEVHHQTRTAPRYFSISLPELTQMIGVPVSPEEVFDTLMRLDIQVHKESEEVWVVGVPLYRLDVVRPVDIAEELLRLRGWETLPMNSHPPVAYPRVSAVDIEFELRHNLSEFLTGMGLWEIRTNSLVGRSHFPPQLTYEPIRLANPLYEELAYLRPSLIGSGLEVLLHNRNHGAVGFWAFEWGRIYHEGGEEGRLGLWGWGRTPKAALGESVSALDYLLALVRALLQRAKVSYYEKLLSSDSLWREGVAFYTGESLIGYAGRLQESFLKPFHLKGELVVAAELASNLILSLGRRMPGFTGISYHPVVVKDLSLYVPQGLTYAALKEALESLQYPYLRRIEPFDQYRDNQGRLSYGIRLYLQANHTLTEVEIHDFLRNAIHTLESLGAIVRKGESI
ncbi:MAG: phenylalanine--tRNA ligase subunit beta [Bacteroidia bacterium]|nr:phenylalanine--tRNA ligase subunit beta [Bacteroidia bacterium]MCX7652990.1 phenylalanine--tRNA ligase subunit beta [Bacteroidia bacterium]MDW8417186.1 phenylalanine--tRNA ligase subunit beta [Bacteroidia bacterium]